MLEPLIIALIIGIKRTRNSAAWRLSRYQIHAAQAEMASGEDTNPVLVGIGGARDHHELVCMHCFVESAIMSHLNDQGLVK